jgi:hypothetical protein
MKRWLILSVWLVVLVEAVFGYFYRSAKGMADYSNFLMNSIMVAIIAMVVIIMGDVVIAAADPTPSQQATNPASKEHS